SMREIYARFSNTDEAEAAIRTLRQRCGGIRAFHIRRRRRLKEGESDLLPASAFALLGAPAFGDPASGPDAGGAMGLGGYGLAVPGLLWSSPEPPGGEDGPAGREDCLLELLVEDGSAARAEALLRAVHGMEVFTVDEM
ncbi:MAG: hypothetical protein PUC47_14040, partial [Oscillospiraceae bacterium]|nr:hypothetical protein [Oscillospiraceae bacterium]